MEVYIFILIILLIAAFSDKKKQWNVVSVVFLCLFGLLRGETVGTDVYVYLQNISHTTWSPKSWNYGTVFEDGFNCLIALWNTLFDYNFLFLGLCNVFFVLSVNHYAKAKVPNYNLFLLFLFLLGYYVQSYNIMRQYFALSIMMLVLSKYNLDNLKKRDLLFISIITFFIAIFFHNSVLLLLTIPIYYLIKGTFLNNKIFYVIIILITLLLFYLDIIRSILGVYSTLFILNEKTTVYFQHSLEKQEEVYSLLRVLFDNLFLLFIILKSRRLDVYCFLYFAAQICINLFAPLSVLFVRVSVILFIISIPLLINVWNSNKMMTKIIIMFYAIVIFVNVLYKNYGDILPYVFWWE